MSKGCMRVVYPAASLFSPFFYMYIAFGGGMQKNNTQQKSKLSKKCKTINKLKEHNKKCLFDFPVRCVCVCL